MRSLPACLAAAFLAVAPSRAALHIDLQVVAATGLPAPGTAEILGTVGAPRLDAAGRAAVAGSVTPALGLETETALFRWNGSALELIARAGDPVPGLSDATFLEVGEGGIDESGRVVFGASLWVDGLPSEGIFEWEGATVATLVLRGDEVPGSPPFIDLGVANLADSGHGVFRANLYDGYWALAPDGAVAAVAQEGDPAPGLPGRMIDHVAPEEALVNDAGEVVFEATAWDGTFDSRREGLFGPDGAGGLTLLGVVSGAAPGAPDTVFQSLEGADLGDGGEAAFLARLEGDVTEFDDTGIWRSESGVTSLLVRTGDPAPDPQGRHFGALRAPQLDGEGRTYFVGILVETIPYTEEDLLGYWRAQPDGTIVELLRSGHPVTDDPGVLLGDIRAATVSERGDVALEVWLYGDDVDMWTDDAILFLSAEGERAILYREGQPLEIAPGVSRTGGQPGLAAEPAQSSARDAISETGRVGFAASIEEGNAAVVATVPEPADALLALTGALVLASQRLARRRIPRQSA